VFRRVFPPCLSLLLVAPCVRAADHVGAESCRSCHPHAYEVWSASRHARSLDTLSRDQRRDARCLQCHARDVQQGADGSVGCESCHGAGGYYWPDYVMRDAELAKAAGLVVPDAKTCLQCHDASSPAVGPFDPAAKMKLIDHWTRPREERAKRAAEARAPAPAKPAAEPASDARTRGTR